MVKVLEVGVAGHRAILACGVTRRYGAAWVLRGVDARFEAGTITVVEGANGVGKSTLMGIVGGLVQPSGGSVVWELSGKGVGERRHAIGWVGHESSCYRELSARENVGLAAAVNGVGESAISNSLERVGASAFAERRVGTLSRGQRQRVALAKGIVHGPELLLLDEPFTGLDFRGCAMLEAIIQQERARGAIVLVVSHDRDLAGRLSASRLFLDRGRAARREVASDGLG